MLTNRLELLSSRRNGDYGDALPLSYVSIIQKCLHPLIVFEFLLLFASLYYITAWTKKYYAITKEERSSPIIVKFAVIKLRGGFKPHFCHTRPCVPILDLSKQCDSLALQLRILGTAPTSIGPLQDTWHLICIFA